MRMNKIVAWSLLLALVFGVNVALAENQPEGTPFKAIWNAIAGLQEQIDNFVATPGPQGEPGSPGQDGEDGQDGEGTPGVQGPSGPSLKVVDANGDLVGYLIDTVTSSASTRPFSSVIVFNDEFGFITSYELDSGDVRVNVTGSLYYTSDDCSGDAYLSSAQWTPTNHPYFLWRQKFVRDEFFTYYTADSYSDVEIDFEYNSWRVNSVNSCDTVSDTRPIAIKIHEIPLPATPGPLEIVVE